MDSEQKKFGRGSRELTGSVDLVSQYRLLPHYDFFCKRSLPLSISDTHYLHNVVGDTEIRKGDGMQLGQLTQYTSLSRETNTRSQPFDLDILSEAFQLRETTPVDLPSVSTFYSLNLRKGQSFCLALLISTLVTSHSLRRVLLQFLGNLKLGLKKRRKNIRSIRTKTKIKTTRSTSIGIKIEVKTRTRRRKRRELAFRILGMIIQEDIMRRRGSIMDMKMPMKFRSTRKVSLRAQRLMIWEE